MFLSALIGLFEAVWLLQNTGAPDRLSLMYAVVLRIDPAASFRRWVALLQLIRCVEPMWKFRRQGVHRCKLGKVRNTIVEPA